MKKIVSMAIAVFLLTGISFGYTLTLHAQDETTTREVETGKTVKIALGDRSPAEYTVNSGNAILRVLGNRRQIVMPEGNVDITIEKLCTVSFESNGGSTVSSKLLSYGETYGTLVTPTKNGHVFQGWYADSELTEPVTSETSMTKTVDHTLYAKWNYVELGSYIMYQPTSTEHIVSGGDSGTGVDQVFNPSSVTSWKVFKNTTDGDYLEIISAESVGDLRLTGKAGYIYAIDILNRLCREYVNPTYATSGRCLGYGNGVGTIDESKYPITFEETYTNGNNGFPYTDSCNKEDIRLLNTKDGENYPLRVSGSVWLDSRMLKTNSSYSYFGVLIVDAVGTVHYNVQFDGNGLYQLYSDGGFDAYSLGYGVRPVITLKSGIRIVGGDGTSENPYQIAI
ncbi:MAG: InlB B-repeat-containing protein [Clostridia bacterium]|nr:InlB B-repeat-containing protein [Clostridia bacterium]